jgi:hypothetical protein
MGKNPPREIPPLLMDKYSLNGRIGVRKWYFNDVGLAFIPRFYTRKAVESFFEKIEKKEILGYKETNKWLYDAISRYSIKNKTCAVMGSVVPFGASDVTTIEYNKLVSFHPKIKTIRPFEYDKNPIEFEVGLSISSFEHDGLGRYGDPVDPDADLQAMKKMKGVVRKGGILFLSVPVGKDMVVWNAHRVYGRIRLPMLLKEWEVVDNLGFEEKNLDMDNERGEYQPVFVLKNI